MKVYLTITTEEPVPNESIIALMALIRQWGLNTDIGVSFGFKDLSVYTYPPSGVELHADYPEVPIEERRVSLGQRAVVIDGSLVGRVEDIRLDIVQASEEEVRKLESARMIGLVKISGEG